MSSPRVGRALAAAAIGNAFEWYDFTVFVLFAPYIARAFFPGGGETAALVKTLLAFGVGFVARPIGAVLIGYYSDRAGRKAALTLTFGLMAVGTLTIALSPAVAVIGSAAPILMLAARLLQGLSAGGEIGGAAAFLVEYAPVGRRARFAAWLQASMAISNILGALVAVMVRELIPEPGLSQWGWRAPFLFGLLIVPIGLWLRAMLDETPEFVAERAREHREPIFSALRLQRAMILRGFGLSILWGVCTYALVIFMPVHEQKALGFRADEAFAAAIAGNLVLIGVCLLSGHLADRIGRLRLLGGAAWALLLLPPLLMALLIAEHSLAMLIFVQIGFCTLAGLYAGAMAATLTELFPTRIRSTGTSIAYNAAFTIFAGFAPAIITWLAASAIGAQAPTLYVSAAAIIALIAIRSFPKAA